MKKSLAESLSNFLSSDDMFENPYDIEPDEESVSPNEFIRTQREPKDSEKKKEKKDKFEKLIDRVDGFVSGNNDEYDEIEDFDNYLEEFMLDDEDDNLRNDLIRRGRQYARSTATSRESSELQKLYAGSEQRLEQLIKEVEEDGKALSEDIRHMREMRSRNYKTLSEMVGERRAHHDTILSAIKEINAMTKAKVELKLKMDKENKDEAADSDITANRAIQNLFSMGRDSLVGSYADVSGSMEAGKEENNEYSSVVDEDEMIDQKYGDKDEEETDGDRFLEYEGMGVEYILEVDEDGTPVQILAEDKDGNEVPGYPIPEMSEDLTFDISNQTKTASDNLARKYKLRIV